MPLPVGLPRPLPVHEAVSPLAVVTTPFGLRGYPALVPHVTVAEPEAFADALAARPRGWNAGGLALVLVAHAMARTIHETPRPPLSKIDP